MYSKCRASPTETLEENVTCFVLVTTSILLLIRVDLSPLIISVVASLAVSKLGEESLLVDAMIIVQTKCICVH